MIGALDENENLTVLGAEIIYFLLMLVFTVYATLPCLQLNFWKDLLMLVS